MGGHGCPWRHLFRLAVHTQLHMRPDMFCWRWKRRMVTEWGIVVPCFTCLLVFLEQGIISTVVYRFVENLLCCC